MTLVSVNMHVLVTGIPTYAVARTDSVFEGINIRRDARSITVSFIAIPSDGVYKRY